MQPVNFPHLLSFSHSLCLARTSIHTSCICIIFALLQQVSLWGHEMSFRSLPVTGSISIHFLIWKRNFETIHFCAFCFRGLKPFWHYFLFSSVWFLSFPSNTSSPPNHPFLSSPPFHSLSNCVLDWTLSLTVPDSLGKAQYWRRLLNTHNHAHTSLIP